MLITNPNFISYKLTSILFSILLLTGVLLSGALQAQEEIIEEDSPDIINASDTHFLTAEQWLLKLSSATSNSNFEISYVASTSANEIIPYLWRHGVMDDGTSVEQLNVQNGPGKELIRVGNVVSVYEPNVQPYSIYGHAIEGRISRDLLYYPERLQNSYHFLKLGRARVTGRVAQLIRIVSKDNSRYSYQVWLDEETGLLLKLNMLDMSGALMEQIQVTSLKLLASPPEYFSHINKDKLPQVSRTKSNPVDLNWDVAYMPVGMKEIKRELRRLPITHQTVEYKMFSDGMVDISIYLQAASDALGENVAARRGLNTFLSLTDGQYQVTIVGKIPMETAQKIANSMKTVK